MWQETEQGLYKKLVFKNFTEAFGFMNRVAEVAEQHGHHPRWTNEYGIVEIWLRTHDQGGNITDKDRELAAEINALVRPKQR